MSFEPEPDSIAWMRKRWDERGIAGSTQFAALVSVLRANAIMTDDIDGVRKTQTLTRTGYLVMATPQTTEGGSRPLGQLSKRLLVHPTTVTMVIDQLRPARARRCGRRPDHRGPADRAPPARRPSTERSSAVRVSPSPGDPVGWGHANGTDPRC